MANHGLLVDTGYFFALYTERDEHHSAAKRKQDLLEQWPIVLPWPVLYETMNTRFVKMPGVLARFGAIVVRPDTVLLDDSPYRDRSYRTAMETASQRPFSLVDAVLRAIVEDTNVSISAMLTFNPRDFYDVCQKHRVALPCQDETGFPARPR